VGRRRVTEEERMSNVKGKVRGKASTIEKGKGEVEKVK